MRLEDDVPVWKVLAVVVGIFVMCGLVGLGMVLFLPRPSWARDGGNWTEVDPEVRAWIQSLTQPDFPGYSCCGPADLYEADLGEVSDDGLTYAIVTNSRGNPLPVGTKLLIPPSKIQNTQGNPTKHVLVFASGVIVFCFIPNGSN